MLFCPFSLCPFFFPFPNSLASPPLPPQIMSRDKERRGDEGVWFKGTYFEMSTF